MSKKTLAIIVILAIVLGVGTVFSLKRYKGNTAEKTTVEQIAELFNKNHNRPAGEIIFKVTTDTGKFAKGTYNEAGGGGLWFAAKTNSGWELAYDGNGIIPCSAANKYNLPTDMVPQCIDTQNGNNLIVR